MTPHFDDDLYDTEADLDLDFKIEQIIEITKCCDISLIKSKLSAYEHDMDLAIEAVFNEQANESEDNTANESKKSSAAVKVDKKVEKKQRQMERQRIKVLEQREREAHTKMAREGPVNTKNAKILEVSDLQQQRQLQQAEDAAQSIDLSNLSLNVQTKSI